MNKQSITNGPVGTEVSDFADLYMAKSCSMQDPLTGREDQWFSNLKVEWFEKNFRFYNDHWETTLAENQVQYLIDQGLIYFSLK